MGCDWWTILSGVHVGQTATIPTKDALRFVDAHPMLTVLNEYWLDHLRDYIPNRDEYPQSEEGERTYRERLAKVLEQEPKMTTFFFYAPAQPLSAKGNKHHRMQLMGPYDIQHEDHQCHFALLETLPLSPVASTAKKQRTDKTTGDDGSSVPTDSLFTAASEFVGCTFTPHGRYLYTITQ